MLKIHHITHIDNLESILKNGILPRNLLKNDGFTDTANQEIILKRYELNDYIPFHINELQIKHGIAYNHEVFNSEGRENIIVFSLKYIEYNENSHKLFVYHPISSWGFEVKNFEIYQDNLNAHYKELPYNNFGPDYNKQKVQNFFMSEILFKDRVDFSLIECIFVYNEEAEMKVKKVLQKYDVEKNVEIKQEFYKKGYK